MKKISLMLLVVVSALLNSCGTSMKVSYDYDRNVDFYKFSTFSLSNWNDDNSELVDNFTKERLLNAMKNEMLKRGMKEVAENPDIKLDIFVVTNTKKYTTAYTTHMGYGGYRGWHGYGGWYGPRFGVNTGSTQFVEHEKLMGTIILDVYDNRTKKLVWQGVSKGELEGKGRPTENSINSVIAKIYYKYPIKKE